MNLKVSLLSGLLAFGVVEGLILICALNKATVEEWEEQRDTIASLTEKISALEKEKGEIAAAFEKEKTEFFWEMERKDRDCDTRVYKAEAAIRKEYDDKEREERQRRTIEKQQRQIDRLRLKLPDDSDI